MAELRSILERLDLSEYADSFISEGFDSWQTLTDITESDLTHLNVKLGHRRKLQRAIADSKAEETRASNPRSINASSHRSAESPEGGNGHGSEHGTGQNSPSSASGFRVKRKYRRHPKPDPNAPERPASAYVRFSNRMRQELADQELTFIEMAKVVGDRWQALPAQEREWYESQAASAKEKYNAEMARYKRTEEYARYQEYLADFKAKSHNHAHHNSTAPDGGKRAKLDGDSATPSDAPARRTSIVSRATSDAQDNASYKSSSPHNASLPSPHATDGPYRPSISPSNVALNRPSVYDYSTRLPTSGPVPRLATLESTNTSSSSRSGSSRSPLSHSIPSLSSESSERSVQSVGTPHPPDLASRVLPLPIPGNRNHYNTRLPPKPDPEPSDPRQTGSLAALLRAGELVAARDSDPNFGGATPS